MIWRTADHRRHRPREGQPTTPWLPRGELFSEEVPLDPKEALLCHRDSKMLLQGVFRASNGQLVDFLALTYKEKAAVG